MVRNDVKLGYFPAFGRGLSLRLSLNLCHVCQDGEFPRLWAGTFIEALARGLYGLGTLAFPRLWAGTFIEAGEDDGEKIPVALFPRLWAGTFIEAR